MARWQGRIERAIREVKSGYGFGKELQKQKTERTAEAKSREKAKSRENCRSKQQ